MVFGVESRAGFLSGGCIEADVEDHARACIADGRPQRLVYGVSKAGLIQMTRWLATTMAPKVRVNAIAPGGVFRDAQEPFLGRYISRTPMGRMATEEDFKGAVAYLASDLSAYVTGQCLAVDGGWTAW